MPNLPARQLNAGSSEVGNSCPYCHTPMQPGESVVACPVDGSVHHVICWHDNNNHCATFQCPGSGAVVASTAVATAINWRAMALWGVAGIFLFVALFRIFDTPVVTQTTPMPAADISPATATATPNATATAVAMTLAAEMAATATARSDADGDGLTLLEETGYGTDPYMPDSDGDDVSDWNEITAYQTNPLNSDSDGDSLSDHQEISTIGSDPNNSDTDNDGNSDGREVAAGSDPLRDAPPTARPTPRPPRAQPSATLPSPVTGLRLINTNSDRPIGPLVDGDTVSLARTGSALSIEALVSGSGVGSVVFYWDGGLFCMNNADRCFENVAPYAMSGDQGGDYYNNWDWSRLTRGRHTVTVVTCSAPGGTGGCAEAMTVTFTIAR